MKKNFLVCIFATLMAVSASNGLYAEETMVEKAETTKNESIDQAKRVYRSSKDKACEMVNGKMECFSRKMKNRAKNMSDRSKTKAKELKNKAD